MSREGHSSADTGVHRRHPGDDDVNVVSDRWRTATQETEHSLLEETQTILG